MRPIERAVLGREESVFGGVLDEDGDVDVDAEDEADADADED